MSDKQNCLLFLVIYHLPLCTVFMSASIDTQKTPQPPAPQPPNFVQVLQLMLGVSDKVSDLIFSPGRPPQIELVGKLQSVAIPVLEKLTAGHTADIIKLII